MPVAVGDGLLRFQVFNEGDSLLQGLDDLLVVQPVRRGLLQGAAVDDRDAAPLPAEAREVGCLSGRAGALALAAHLRAVMEKAVQNLPLFAVEERANPCLSALRDEFLVAGQHLLGQQGVVGEKLRRRVDGGQPAADDDRRQLDLQVGERLFLERACQLQRHQEVRRLSDAADDVVLHPDDRGPPRARRDGHVVEPRLEGLLGRERASEAHTAQDREPRAPRQRQVYERQEVLVPADGDPVLGDPSESRQRTPVERALDLTPVTDGPNSSSIGARPVGRQRLDLQPADSDDAEALVDKEMGERVAGRTQADDQDLLAVVRERVGPRGGERIPPGQKPIDLDSPRKRQDVSQDPRLDLRDVDGLLLLEDASLHAVVADAVASAGAHRVVNADERERSDRVAFAPQLVHLGNLLVERAARESDAQRVLLEGGRLLVEEALRAGVLLPLVAEDAVVGLSEHLAAGHPPDRQLETLAAAAAGPGSHALLRKSAVGPVGLYEGVVIHGLRQVKGGPAADFRCQLRTPQASVRPEGVGFKKGFQERQKRLVGFSLRTGEQRDRALERAASQVARPGPGSVRNLRDLLLPHRREEVAFEIEESRREFRRRELRILSPRQFRVEPALDAFGGFAKRADIAAGGVVWQLRLDGPPLEKIPPEPEEHGLGSGGGTLLAPLLFYSEETRDKAAQRPRGVHKQAGAGEGNEGRW